MNIPSNIRVIVYLLFYQISLNSGKFLCIYILFLYLFFRFQFYEKMSLFSKSVATPGQPVTLETLVTDNYLRKFNLSCFSLALIYHVFPCQSLLTEFQTRHFTFQIRKELNLFFFYRLKCRKLAKLNHFLMLFFITFYRFTLICKKIFGLMKMQIMMLVNAHVKPNFSSVKVKLY